MALYLQYCSVHVVTDVEVNRTNTAVTVEDVRNVSGRCCSYCLANPGEDVS